MQNKQRTVCMKLTFYLINFKDIPTFAIHLPRSLKSLKERGCLGGNQTSLFIKSVTIIVLPILTIEDY